MEETVIYYQFGDGSVAERVVTGGTGTPTPPDGAVEITEAEYQAALATIVDENQQGRDDLEEEEQARAKGDYDALIALGMPEETARRLSGYRGPAVERST